MSEITPNLLLDRALEQWADAQSLSPSRAAAIRDAILATTAEDSRPLDLEWWLTFRAQLDESLQTNLLTSDMVLPGNYQNLWSCYL